MYTELIRYITTWLQSAILESLGFLSNF